jgi:hypothetical protein
MKNLKEFLLEMPLRLLNYSEEEGRLHKTKKWFLGKKISTHPKTGHDIYMKGKVWFTYRAVHPKTKKIEMEVQGYKNRGHFQISTLAGVEGSTIKAHQLYHHLIHHHGVTLRSSNIQSGGGAKTWKSLSQYPDIEMTHEQPTSFFRKPPNLPIHHDKEWDKNYAFGFGGDLPPNRLSRSYFVAKKRNL